MENRKITKVGLCVVAALVGGINYVSFTDMGDNIDKHVVEPIKVSIQKNRIEKAKEKALEAAREEKNRLMKKKSDEDDMQKEIARLRKENEQIKEQERNRSTEPVNVTMPRIIQGSGDNRAFMTAFGVTNADEAVKSINKISDDESYIIFRTKNGQNLYAKLASDVKNEPGSLTPTTDKNYTNIIESQSGQKYIYEGRCDYIGTVAGNIKIIPDSPSIVSISRQVCSIVPIKTEQVGQPQPVETPVVVNNNAVTPKSNVESQKISYSDINRNLDFSKYNKITSSQDAYLKVSGAKTGDVTFHMSNDIIDEAEGSNKAVNKNMLNDYYNSVFVTTDGSRYVYNSSCSYVFAKSVKINTRQDADGHEKAFVETHEGIKNDRCSILPLTTN